MSARPIVAVVLPRKMCTQMFRPGELDRLRAVSDLRVVQNDDRIDPSLLPGLIDGARVVITGWGTPSLIKAVQQTQQKPGLIAHSAGSVKRLVDETTFALGVRVSNAAFANARPVAEFSVGLMQSLLKQIPWLGPAYARGDRAEVERRRALCREMQDLKVGIIAASRVGREVIRLLKSYQRLDVRLYDPYVTSDDARSMGVELVSLEDACRCDIVSIHAPNIPETRHLFNARTLPLLPDHGVLINTARGALIDERALVAEVRRRPLYVALDVTDPEPPAPDSPLRNEPNIILTPHIAGAMCQARLDMGQIAVDETLRFLNGQPLGHEVTAAMLPTQA